MSSKKNLADSVHGETNIVNDYDQTTTVCLPNLPFFKTGIAQRTLEKNTMHHYWVQYIDTSNQNTVRSKSKDYTFRYEMDAEGMPAEH